MEPVIRNGVLWCQTVELTGTNGAYSSDKFGNKCGPFADPVLQAAGQCGWGRARAERSREDSRHRSSNQRLVVSLPVVGGKLPRGYNPADGTAGAFVGADYTATLFYIPGTTTNQGQFDSSNPSWLVNANFFGTTGTGPAHGYNGDGSGFF